MSAVLDFYNDELSREEFSRGDVSGELPRALRQPRHLASVPAPPPSCLAPDPTLAPLVELASIVELHTGLQATPLRLTVRGRIVAALAVLSSAALILVAAELSHPAPTHPSAAAIPAVVAVQPGDTLWSIALRVAPSKDPRNTVESLRRVNHLASVQLTPGQKLRTH